MGFIQALAKGLSGVVNKGQDSNKLALIFQKNEGFARLAFQQFQRAASIRGIEVNERLINEASMELRKYPSLTFGEFLDSYANNSMNKDRWK